MYLNTEASHTHTHIPASHDHASESAVSCDVRHGGPHQKREEIELQCEAVGGDPTGLPLAGLPPVLHGVLGVRTFVCCAVNVCVV